MSSIKSLEQKQTELMLEVNTLSKKINELKTTDPYGLLEIINKIHCGYNSQNIITYCTEARYSDDILKYKWFYMRFPKDKLPNIIGLEFTSYLAHNDLYIFNILQDDRNSDNWYVQISTKEGIQNHLAKWSTDETP